MTALLLLFLLLIIVIIIIIIIVITYRNMCLVIIPPCSDFRMGLHNHEKSYEVCICS